MITTNDIFISEKILDENLELHIVDVEYLTPEILDYINEHFVTICEGDSGSNLETVKKRALSFFENKTESTKMGAIAEFFIHLYLKKQGFKQECMFFNLEEGSIKKGFDGYYSIDEKEWIMESKSGNVNSQSITHSKKITEAYNDLVDKFKGNVSNNPWKNAYNHASQIDVRTSGDIRKNIKFLSDNFTNQIFPSINDFNIIPAATIFLNGQWENYDVGKLKQQISKNISKFNYRKILIICLTKKSTNLIIDFLKK